MPPLIIQALQHICRMRGGSQAQLLRASDNHYYVTKFRNNPQAVKILANEYLASKLGSYLGLPMAEVAILSVPEWLVANSPELKIDHGGYSVPCTSGLQFGSRYVVNPVDATVFDYLPESMMSRVSNLQDFARVLAFDKWTGNADGRQAVFTKAANKRLYHAIFIDHGYCFNAGEWNFPDSPLRGVYARNQVYAHVSGWHDFESTLSRIEDIDATQIWNIAREIPEEWYQNHAEGLEQLIDALHQRRLTVRNLISDFRNSSRNPFPNWTAQTSFPENTTQNKPKEEKIKMTDQKFKAVFVLNSETQSFKPTAHNLGADLAMEQFSADPNARIVDQSERHRTDEASKCRTCKKQAEELTKQNIEVPATPEQQEEPAAQESESD